MVNIGRWRLPSKLQAKAWCRQILSRLANHRPAPRDDEFVRALLDRHPNRVVKIGCGIMRFEARPNLNGDLEFWIIRNDGTETDFSFLKCIDGSRHKDDVLVAMRQAIAAQIRDARDRMFSEQLVLISPYLHHSITADSCEMNHFPPFADIAGRFVAMAGGYDAIGTVSVDGERGQHFADIDIEQRWQEFHYRNASLEAVSVEENRGICEVINRMWHLDNQRQIADRKRKRGYDVDCNHPEHREYLQRNNLRCSCLFKEM